MLHIGNVFTVVYIFLSSFLPRAQEIIDALATPGARGLLALLNEPLFDEVLIRRTKYGMDCLLLLLQFLPFDVEERDAAQVCLCVGLESINQSPK